MSITHNGRQITCNGDGCQAEADAPVALHPLLCGDDSSKQQINGWLFIASGGEWRHYCPSCLIGYLTYFHS